MMKVLGRTAEIAKLRQITDSEQAEFVAVYGRRRIGKTFLIREYFNNEFCFYATGLANANTKKTANKLRHFYESVF